MYAGFAEQTRNLIPFDRIAINLILSETDDFMPAYVFGTAVPGRGVGEVSPLRGTLSGEVRRQRRAIMYHSTTKDETLSRFYGLSREYEIGLRSFLSVPLIYGDAVIGILNFRSVKMNAYTGDDAEVAELIAAQVAGAIANSRLHAETVKRDMILQQQAEELVRSNADLEQFAYAASHDLQEPLRVIAGYVHLLEERYADELDQDARDFIGFAVDATHRMRTLINDLLEYSRVESHGNPFETVDCNSALSEAMADLEVSITESDAAITSDPLPEIFGDPVQIAHVLENLIANAIKFRKEDVSPIIHVSSRRNGEDWQISVKDNGIESDPDTMTAYSECSKGLTSEANIRGPE